MPNIKISGLDALDRALRNLGVKMRKQVIGQALGEAAEIIQNDAARRAPVGKTHRLSSGMTITRPDFRTPDQATVGVGPSRRAFYGRFLENGTKYITAEPFLEPALDANKERCVLAMENIIDQAIGEADANR